MFYPDVMEAAAEKLNISDLYIMLVRSQMAYVFSMKEYDIVKLQRALKLENEYMMKFDEGRQVISEQICGYSVKDKKLYPTCSPVKTVSKANMNRR